jgi:phosphoribosylaminoimidazolecarboxamide formyltransferase / IMP cyclohydrolase
MNLIKIKRALISVSDKELLHEIAHKLAGMGCEIISTGGTAKYLRESAIEVIDIQSITGNPEAFQGRMKTISFKIESALLYDRENDAREAEKLGIMPIDLVICNLYPFQKRLAEKAKLPVLIENIDIGGPTMIRAAAKNYKWVTVITDPNDYSSLADELDLYQGAVSEEFRFNMMRAAFNHTADYDAMIAETLDNITEQNSLRLSYKKVQDLRYGENSHQKAAMYIDNSSISSLAELPCLHGKKLSYNNIIDIEAALLSVRGFNNHAIAIIKHSNPCGYACAASQYEALNSAWSGDPASAFGSIIAFNKPLEYNTAKYLKLKDKDKSQRKFIEVIIAPDFSEETLEYLSFHKNLRIVRYDPDKLVISRDFRFIQGGLLLQDSDDSLYDEIRLVTVPKQEINLDRQYVRFGIRAVRHLKSNAIAIVESLDEGSFRLLGMGAGQPNRLISTQLALDKARENLRREAFEKDIADYNSYYQERIARCLLVSDAFFPFADNIELAAEHGIRTIIQPGGSIRDNEVISEAQKSEITMYFTGMRHFRH